MADAAQRQRRLAAKAARRKAVVAEKKKGEAGLRGLAGRVRAAAQGPIELCRMPAGLFEIGIGHLVIARTLPSGLLGSGFFLVDPFCLGVKEVIYGELPREELHTRLANSAPQTFIDVAPAKARKLIHAAVAYAANLGLAPAEDYRAVEALFGDVDPGACDETFTFGQDGKPFYVTGPLDRPNRIRQVTKALEQRCGPGGWHFLIGQPPVDSWSGGADEA